MAPGSLRLAIVAWALVGLFVGQTPALAQLDLQTGIQSLVGQMVASMEQPQERNLAVMDFGRLADGSVGA